MMIRLDYVDLALVRCVNTMLHLGRRHPRSTGYYREAGQALAALREDKPRSMWAEIVRHGCGLGMRRAYELMQLGTAGKPLAKLRAETSARVRKHRKNKSLSTKPPTKRGSKRPL